MKKTDELNDYEILDVDPQADAAEIQMAYIRARRALKPESVAHYSIVSEEEKEKLRVKIEMAYRNLVGRQRGKNLANKFSENTEISDNRETPAIVKKIVRLQKDKRYRKTDGNQEGGLSDAKRINHKAPKKRKILKTIALHLEKSIFLLLMFLFAAGLFLVIKVLIP